MDVVRLSGLLLAAVIGMLGTAQASAAPPSPDVSYLNASHQTNLAIIQASQVAKSNGRACVRQAAARLEADHRRLAAQELGTARQLGVGLIAIPSLAQRQQLSALWVRTGSSAYDAAWLAFQRQQHHRQLALIRGELTYGRDAAVRSVAIGAQAVVQMDLRMVEPTCHVDPDDPRVPTGDGGQMAEAEQRRFQAGLVLLGLGVLLLAGKPIRAKRHLLGLSAVIVAIALVFGEPPGEAGNVPQAGPPGSTGGRSTPEREASIPPVRVALPGVVNTAVVPVATGRDGQLQVPKSQATVGWWAGGAGPGSAGGTVLLVGHVDSDRQGRGVFAPLWDVPVGAAVAVTAGDGRLHRYRIVARRIYRQEKLPTDLFRGSPEPRLALVTCIRSYDTAQHRYTHNLVLYGSPTR